MLEWIKTFITVYETKNFSIAAKELFVSQPTVSLQIKKLENHLNLQLFDRKGKQTVVPTKEAHFLYPKLLNVLDNLSYSFMQATQKENFTIECILACSNTTAIHMLPKVMKALTAAFPLLSFTIQMMNSQEVVTAVQNGDAHIGLLEKPISTTLMKKEIVYEDELVLAGHPEAEFWILREEESGIRFFNEIYLNEQNLHPKIIKVNNNEVLLQLIQQNIGRSIVSKLAIANSIYWEPLDELSKRRNIFIVKGNIQEAHAEIAEVYEWIKNNLSDILHPSN